MLVLNDAALMGFPSVLGLKSLDALAQSICRLRVSDVFSQVEAA